MKELWLLQCFGTQEKEMPLLKSRKHPLTSSSPVEFCTLPIFSQIIICSRTQLLHFGRPLLTKLDWVRHFCTALFHIGHLFALAQTLPLTHTVNPSTGHWYPLLGPSYPLMQPLLIVKFTKDPWPGRKAKSVYMLQISDVGSIFLASLTKNNGT